MGNFDINDCGQAQVDLDLHPLTEAWRSSVSPRIVYPAELTAMNNIVLSGIVVPFPAFDTDGNGQYQSDDLIGKRFVVMNAANMPMNIEGEEITLNSTTGEVQSIYANQTHTGSIGYELGIDLMP